jgi:hypothetical protein
MFVETSSVPRRLSRAAGNPDDDDVFYLFFRKQKSAQRYIPTASGDKDRHVMMPLSCSLWRHTVPFSPSVEKDDVTLNTHLSTAQPHLYK